MDFQAIFDTALDAGLGRARAGGREAEKWLRHMAEANRRRLQAIFDAMASGDVSAETGATLLDDNADIMRGEAATLTIIARATAQGAVNAFLATLRGGIASALRIAI